MHLSFIWEKEYSSSFAFAPLSLYFSFITEHVSSPVSLGVPCTSPFYFAALSLSASPLFSSLTASSTLCCFHCLYENFPESNQPHKTRLMVERSRPGVL